MTKHWKAIAIAVLAGLAIGTLDSQAHEVQGALLLLMLVAFIQSVATRVPAWLLMLPLVAGLLLAYTLSWAAGRSSQFNPGLALALVPIGIAVLGGRIARGYLDAAKVSMTGEAAYAIAPSRAHAQAYLLPLAIAGCIVLGLVPVYAVSVARGQPFPWFITIIWQLVTLFIWMFMLGRLVRAGIQLNNPDRDGLTAADLKRHALIVAGIAAAHAAALPIMTVVLHIPLGPGGVRAAIPWTLAAYLPLDALTYCLLVGVAIATDANRRLQLSAMLEEAFRGQQATVRLASLHAQLRPHFLFNALNAGAVLARRGDAAGAARVLSGLGDLLRYVLRGTEGDGNTSGFVTLAEELSFAESYFAIEKERFPDRLSTSIQADGEVTHAMVPHLLVQPLVENAIKHGIGARIGAGKVTVRAWREADVLHVSVDDDGPGVTSSTCDSEPHGIGLSNTRSRLLTLYGTKASLGLSTRREGGASAHVMLPFTT